MSKIPVGETKGIKFCCLLVLVAPTHFLRLREVMAIRKQKESVLRFTIPSYYQLVWMTGLKSC